MSRLLVEQVERVEVLNEQTKAGRKLYLEGNYILTEAFNRNRRWYDKGLMEASVEEYIKDYIDERRAIGELNHPEYPFPNIKTAAILTKSLTWHGNNVAGKSLVLDEMEDGRIIKTLLDAGFNLGVSTRGLGEVFQNRDGTEKVTNYQLNAIDAVDRPSGQNCYVTSLTESWVQTPTGVWAKVPVQQIKEAAHAEPSGFNESAFLNALDKYVEGNKGQGKSVVSMFI